MSKIKSKLESFKQIVIRNCENENFEYKEWFVRDHLLIVEQLAMELCDIYSDADRDLVFALVWLHDFGKPFDMESEREITRAKGKEALREVGLREDFIQEVMRLWERIEKKNEVDISKEAIEAQIISSADGASHFVGKFYATYFRDDSKENIASIEKRLKAKIIKDWEKKIVLPELKKVFHDRYLKALELVGEYPGRFVN